MGRISGRFARVGPRLRAGRLVLGLLSDLPRKNCWTIAEWAGEKTPHGMQHLLCRAGDRRGVRETTGRSDGSALGPVTASMKCHAFFSLRDPMGAPVGSRGAETGFRGARSGGRVAQDNPTACRTGRLPACIAVVIPREPGETFPSP
ncbi:transposase (plasmid) [Streptomyces clavuligerus]|uniref:Transposase n=1 Tax=Streptomyces clavuligerus TaxID=1901 RepID=D5SIU5_STRCL|nr:transposase [Streptomyces clavuligerus]